jgi:putative two-component system response regulator
MLDIHKYTILMVDDEPATRGVIAHMLEGAGYATIEAGSGHEALDILFRKLPDLILLDLVMPGMGGLDLLRTLKSEGRTLSIPTIIITGVSGNEARISALQGGVADYLIKPFDKTEPTTMVENHIRLREYRNLQREHAESLERKIAEKMAQLNDSYHETIYLLTSAAEFRDEDTGAHIRRVSHFTAEIARSMGMAPDYIDCIFYASPMHDIGKIAVSDLILYKPTALDEQEWVTMKSHTIFVKRILGNGKTAYIRMGAEIAESHHERWDGGGYPYGLSRDTIPLTGSIISICDSYDALRVRRPYKQPVGHEETVRIITRGDGRTDPKHFRPEVLSAFSTCEARFREIYEAYTEEL